MISGTITAPAAPTPPLSPEPTPRFLQCVVGRIHCVALRLGQSLVVRVAIHCLYLAMILSACSRTSFRRR